MWWLLLGCMERTTEPVVAEGPCAAWAGQPDVFGYCLTSEAGATALDATAACAGSGTWQEACQDAWVTARLGGELGIAELLSACASDDCRFQVLDARPTELREQVARCEAHAGVHEEDCVRHALSAWLASRPDATAVANLQEALHERPLLAGRHAAAAIACHGEGACAGSDDVRQHCEASLVEIAAEAGFCERLLGTP